MKRVLAAMSCVIAASGCVSTKNYDCHQLSDAHSTLYPSKELRKQVLSDIDIDLVSGEGVCWIWKGGDVIELQASHYLVEIEKVDATWEVKNEYIILVH